MLLQLPHRRAPRVHRLSQRPTPPRELEAVGEQLRVLAEEHAPVPDAGPAVPRLSALVDFRRADDVDLPRRRLQSRLTFRREVFLRVNRALAVRELICSLEALKPKASLVWLFFFNPFRHLSISIKRCHGAGHGRVCGYFGSNNFGLFF